MKNLWMKTLVKNTFNHLRLSSSPLYQLKALTYLDALSPLHNGRYTAFIVSEWLWLCTKFSNFNYSTLHNKRIIEVEWRYRLDQLYNPKLYIHKVVTSCFMSKWTFLFLCGNVRGTRYGNLNVVFGVLPIVRVEYVIV